MTFRNITADLRDRLAAVEAERKRLDAKEAALRSLLAAEEALWSTTQPTLFPLSKQSKRAPSRRRPIVEQSTNTKFLVSLLSDGQIWPIDKIAEKAIDAGLIFGAKSPGRVLHFVLLGMAQRGFVEQAGQGRWKAVGREKGDAAA